MPSLNLQGNPILDQAALEIRRIYGDVVDFYFQPRTRIKFGKNPNLGTSSEIVWNASAATENLPSSDIIDTIVSDNIGDTGNVYLEGFTIDDGELTFVTQNVTLTGTTPVTLDTPLARVTRLISGTIVSGVETITALNGEVTVYESDTPANIHLTVDGTSNQSLKCADAVDNNDYLAVTSILVGVQHQQTSSVDFNLVSTGSNSFITRLYLALTSIIERLLGIQRQQTSSVGSQTRSVDLNFRIASTNSNSFVTKLNFSCSTDGGSLYLPLTQPIIVPRNHDYRIEATSSGPDTIVTATVMSQLGRIRT